MEVQVEHSGDKTILTVTGQMDMEGAPALQDCIRTVIDGIEGAPRLTLDLSGVPFIDSSGIAVVIDTYQRAKARKGTLNVSGLSDFARGVFQVLNLEKFLTQINGEGAAT